MDSVLWIIICLFASIGFVQAVGWLFCVASRPKDLPRGYTILTMYAEPGLLEQQLRHELVRRKWDAMAQYTYLILIDDGLDGECRQIYERMLRDVYGIFVCTPQTLQKTVATFDNLQTGQQRI